MCFRKESQEAQCQRGGIYSNRLTRGNTALPCCCLVQRGVAGGTVAGSEGKPGGVSHVSSSFCAGPCRRTRASVQSNATSATHQQQQQQHASTRQHQSTRHPRRQTRPVGLCQLQQTSRRCSDPINSSFCGGRGEHFEILFYRFTEQLVNFKQNMYVCPYEIK